MTNDWPRKFNKIGFTIRGRMVQGSGFCLLVEAPDSALEAILRDIGNALKAKLYYLAVAVSLSIPDICAALECAPDRIWVNETKYKAWFEANLSHLFSTFNSRDCWALRGGVVHNARFYGHKQARYDRVAFTLPNRSLRAAEFISANNGGVDESALLMDVEIFCGRMAQGARKWLLSKASDPNVQANLPELVRFRANGLPPHLVGVPVIA